MILFVGQANSSNKSSKGLLLSSLLRVITQNVILLSSLSKISRVLFMNSLGKLEAFCERERKSWTYQWGKHSGSIFHICKYWHWCEAGFFVGSSRIPHQCYINPELGSLEKCIFPFAAKIELQPKPWIQITDNSLLIINKSDRLNSLSKISTSITLGLQRSISSILLWSLSHKPPKWHSFLYSSVNFSFAYTFEVLKWREEWLIYSNLMSDL